ncbi:nuclear factor NF3 [Babesia ovata]|uniref:Nuclear factor NF3 n=1 Tax=Babesia ovata TaxID=189622 RepID=A0A2H6K6A8_9APIC|nr:nuclear factor NF3 [Babesia ovata]GBE58519.1 nuclear factor NF3 [Babesia ovata]
MLFATVIAPGATVTPKDDLASIVHLSHVCLNEPKNNEKTYLQLVDGSKTFNLCCLQKDVHESANLDIFFSVTGNVKLTTKGGKNEVHVTGYFEPEEESYVSDSDDEDIDDEEGGEDEEEGSEDEEPAAKRKNPGKGSKK